jgi:glycosyltransferase involved in cell wall biosynthesis
VKQLTVAILATDKRDHERDYSNPVPSFGTAPEALFQGLATLREIAVHVVSCTHQALASPGKIAPNIYYHGIVVPKLGWMRSLYFGCSRAARRKLREICPDIVHGQGTELDCGLGAVRSGFRNVLTIHGNMKALAQTLHARVGSFHWLAARLEGITLRKSDGVFCNSAYTERLVSPRARKTWRVPNAVRPAFLINPPRRTPAVSPVILCVGIIQRHKSQLELLRVASNLHARGLKFELRFAGGLAAHSEYAAAFAREVVVAQQKGFARHLGSLSTEQLIAAMDAADALVHYPTEESFGLVVAEALARNLKFFGAAIGGVPDILNGVDGAELVAPGDLKPLAEAIAGWLQRGCPLSQPACGVMRERYHPEVVARRHLEIYREVLKK